MLMYLGSGEAIHGLRQRQPWHGSIKPQDCGRLLLAGHDRAAYWRQVAQAAPDRTIDFALQEVSGIA